MNMKKEKIQQWFNYRWLAILLLATLCAALASVSLKLPFLLLAVILSFVGLLFAYHKWIWLVLFILSNIPTLTSTVLARSQPFSTGKTVLFFILFLLTLGSSYYIARKNEIIPSVSWKYFSLPKTLAGFGFIFLVSILTGIFAQVTKQAPTTNNQEALNQLQTMIPIAVFAAQTLGAAFLEELVYRVGFFEIIFKNQKYLAFIGALLLFAYMHSPSDLYSWLTYGLMSLVLTSFYAKYRNFYLNMSIHLSWNLFGLLLALLIK